MDRLKLHCLSEWWFDKCADAVDIFDRDTSGKRGPKREFPTRVLLLGYAYLMWERQTPQVSFLYRKLQTASAEDLALFGIETAPTRRQLYRLQANVMHYQRSGEAPDPHLQWLFDMLVTPSADGAVEGPYDDDGVRSLDSTWFNGFTSIAGIDTDAAKEGKASDRDARVRFIGDGMGGGKTYLGYVGINVTKVVNGREVIERCTVRPADADDAPIGISLVLDDPVGSRAERLLIDRGFSQGLDELNRLRDAGVYATIDYDKDDLGKKADVMGNWYIDGAMYAKCLPRRLHHIPHPGARATTDQKDAWRKKHAEREKYLLPTNGKPGTNYVRYQSAARRYKIKCAMLPELWHKVTDRDAPYCDVPHAPGKGCLMNTYTHRVARGDTKFQWPPYGSVEYQQVYRRRSEVERSNARLKSDEGGNFRAGKWRVRGIEKVSLMYALAAVVANLAPRL